MRKRSRISSWDRKLNLRFFSLQGKLFSDTESIQARAEAAMLLKQLDFPVCILLVFVNHAYCYLYCIFYFLMQLLF